MKADPLSAARTSPLPPTLLVRTRVADPSLRNARAAIIAFTGYIERALLRNIRPTLSPIGYQRLPQPPPHPPPQRLPPRRSLIITRSTTAPMVAFMIAATIPEPR
jgi:hypothetical protein